MTEYVAYYPSPVGVLKLVATREHLVEISFCSRTPRLASSSPGSSAVGLNTAGTKKRLQLGCPVLLETVRQLAEYFNGERKSFDLPLKPRGTDFQKRVWENLLCIPFGETWSYSELATKVAKPKAARAVGGANNKNPIAIVIPCHRVVGKNGALVGYAGGLSKKKKLLDLELQSF